MGVLVNWVEDLSAIETLQQNGVAYKIENVRLREIDWVASRKNKARIEVLDDAHKESIKKAMADRRSVPMIVLRRIPGGVLVIAGGNHRANADLELNGLDSVVRAYVIECNDSQFEVVATELNFAHGKGLSEHEKLRRATALVQSGLLTNKEAADRFGFSPNKISRELKSESMLVRLCLSDCVKNRSIVRTIPESHVALEGVARAYADFIRESKPTGPEVAILAEDVSKQKSESEMIEVIKARSKQPKRVAPVPDKNKADFLRSFRAMTSVAGRCDVRTLSLSTIERKEVAELCAKIIKALNR